MQKLQEILNFYGQKKEPILFVINFDLSDFFISPLNKLPKDILYFMDNKPKHQQKTFKKPLFQTEHTSFERYKKAFDSVQEEIKNGNTYLLNLTFPTEIKTDMSLKEIFITSDARFKLLFKDEFVCFSPERFIKIENNTISTYPMKGTIDAKIKNAKNKILNNKKEMAEHTMVVDLLRNDLSIVSKNVRVGDFRYVEKIKAGERELLQVSSSIKGDLEKGWQNKLGEVITKMLPAGSISGTPKKRTIEIIKDVEKYDREYFSGIFGVFDGENLDSAVMIRFIQKNSSGDLLYKSGGGITIDSDLQKEYKEMCEKVYVPFF